MKDYSFNEARDRKIWIPHMNDSAFILAAALRGKGFDARVLPRSEDSGFNLGRKYTDGDQCIPSIVTTEDILKRVYSDDFNPVEEAFFQGKSEGPCRFGRYYMNQQLILEKIGLKDVPILTMDNKHGYTDLGSDFMLYAWNGSVAQGLLERMLHFTRPFEINKGESERVYQESIEDLGEKLEESVKSGTNIFRIISGKHQEKIIESLRDSREKFRRILVQKENRPLIFITGEFYVRASDVANQNLVKKVEDLGAIAVLEPAFSFFSYVAAVNSRKRNYGSTNISFLDSQKYKIQLGIMERDLERIEHIFPELPVDCKAEEAIDRGSKYIHPTCTVETLLTLGGSDYFASHGIDGIINTMPHNCMPGVMVAALSRKLRKNHNNIPFLNLSYDGHPDPNREDQLEVFIHQILSRKN